MATQAGEIEVKLSLTGDDFKKALNSSQKELQSFGSKASSFISEHSIAITAALAGIVAFAKKSIDAYAEQEVATSKLVKALENQGIATKATVNHLTNLAGALQRTTGYADEAIISAQALMTTFGLQGTNLDRATQAALDMSAALGVDLNAAAQLVGKAFVGETGALSRYGIVIGKNVQESEKFAAVLREVEGRFGGSAAAQAATFSGQLKQMGIAFSELEEAVGRIIAGEGGGIVGWITAMLNKLTDAITVISNVRGQFSSFGDFLRTFAISILGTIVLTITTLLQKVFEMIGQIPILGAQYRFLGGVLAQTNGWIENQIVKLQSSKIQAAQAAGVMVASEQRKVAAFRNTAQQMIAITEQQSLFVKDSMAEELKLRSEHAAAVKAAQKEFGDSFMETEAEMWQFATQLSTSFFNGVGDSFAAMIVDGKSLSDAMKNVFRDMARQIISYIVSMIARLIAFLILREAARRFGGAYGQAAAAAMTASANATDWGGGGMASGGFINEPSILTGLRSGRSHVVGEAGPEAVVPMNKSVAEMGGGGGVTINISGYLIEGNEAAWQRLMREKIVPEIRRFTMAAPTGPFNRRRGVA